LVPLDVVVVVVVVVLGSADSGLSVDALFLRLNFVRGADESGVAGQAAG
jgi:hypothetical protein